MGFASGSFRHLQCTYLYSNYLLCSHWKKKINTYMVLLFWSLLDSSKMGWMALQMYLLPCTIQHLRLLAQVQRSVLWTSAYSVDEPHYFWLSHQFQKIPKHRVLEINYHSIYFHVSNHTWHQLQEKIHLHAFHIRIANSTANHVTS